MKRLALLIILFTSLVYAQKYPVNGKKYLLEYDAKKSILKDASELKVVYAFDYWSAAGQPEDGHDSLFNNVLHPDPGRKYEAAMTLGNGKWQANIDIPADVKLLSYYITDGKNSDYNDEKTYVKYVCDDKGKPVQGARFRNIDFMLMAGKTKADVIKEMEIEIKEYPDHFLSYIVYWKYRFENAKNLVELAKLKPEADKQFERLKSVQKSDEKLLDLLGYELRVNDEFFSYVGKTYTQTRTSLQEKLIALCNVVPAEKRSAIVNREYDRFKKTLDAKIFSETIIGKPAPDFRFTDLKGNDVRLSSFKGKYVLLDFWGTWCGPCVGEIPNLVKAFNMFKDKGFEIISITSDGLMKTKSKEDLAAYITEKGMNWIHCYDSKELGIIDLYKINHFPTLYLLDKEGRVIKDESRLRGEGLITTLEEVIGK